MGDSFELLEQEILAKRIELENAGDSVAITNLEIDLLNLYLAINTNYFIAANTELTHTERFSEMFKEDIGDTYSTVGDTHLEILKRYRYDFNRYLYSNTLINSNSLDDLETHLVIRKQELKIEGKIRPETTWRGNLHTDIINIYTRIEIVIRTETVFSVVEKFVNLINHDAYNIYDIYYGGDLSDAVDGSLLDIYRRMDASLMGLLIRSNSIPLLIKYIELKRREAELQKGTLDYGNILEEDVPKEYREYSRLLDAIADIRYRWGGLVAYTKSIDDLISEYNFAFETRFYLEKKHNKNYLDQVRSANIQRFEGRREITELLGHDILPHRFSTYELYFEEDKEEIEKAKENEFEVEYILWRKYYDLLWDSYTGLRDDDSGKYFYAKREIEKYENFIVRLDKEADETQEIIERKRREHLNKINAINVRKQKLLECIPNKYHDMVEKVFLDFSTGRISKVVFDHRIKQLESLK